MVSLATVGASALTTTSFEVGKVSAKASEVVTALAGAADSALAGAAQTALSVGASSFLEGLCCPGRSCQV